MKNKFQIENQNTNKNNPSSNQQPKTYSSKISNFAKKFELSPIRSESSVPSEKLFEESEKSIKKEKSIRTQSQ